LSAPAALLLVLLAQAPSPWAISAIVEPRRESLKYHFDNPSAFDTAELVPHFFEQTYDTDNIRVGARIDHPVFGARGVFAADVTPAVTRRADDFDTFFQPDGNVIVSGTTGNASLQSWRIAERIEMGRVRAARFGLGYTYRRDRARFGVGDAVTTTTIPPSTTHRIVTTRETTVSRLHAVPFFLDVSRGAGRRGELEAVVDAAPVALARLTVDLPDKYPGRVLAFNAKVATLDARATYRYLLDRWSMHVGVGAGRTFTWRASARLDRRAAFVLVGFTRRLP
jgi:hypothetical protein